MDVSVIIVNYKTPVLLDECLSSFYQHTKDVLFEVIVVDNASFDGSVEMVKLKYPQVKLVESQENVGFGRANNLGFEVGTGKYFFLLNSDTILLNNAIKMFYDYAEQKENWGALGTYLLDEQEEVIHSYYYFPTMMNSFFHELKLFFRPFIKESLDVIDKKVDYITGADLFIPAALIKGLGGFDPIFFMYFEEVDLQWRMKLNGYKRLIFSGPKIIHLEGKSTSVSQRRRFMFEKSRFLFLRKYNSAYLVFIYKLYYVFFRILRNSIKREHSFKANIEYYLFLLKQ
jgi:GT2 family glycosyltransferase